MGAGGRRAEPGAWRAIALAALVGCASPAAGSPPAPAAAATADEAVPPAREAEAEAAAPASETEAPDASGVRRVELSASGDLVPNALVMGSVRAAPTEAEGYARLLEGYAAAIAERRAAGHVPINAINLEVPLVDDRVPLDAGWPRSRTWRPRRAPVLGASPALAPVLSSIGVDVVQLANNHAFDQACAGLRATRDALVGAGLSTVGASEDHAAALGPVIVETRGARVGFVALTTAYNRTARDEPRIWVGHEEPEAAVAAALEAARAQADVVVALVHWGQDFLMHDDYEMRAIARRLVDQGADVIFGTGPHVLHRAVRMPSPRGEALVAYSLGNAASGMGRAYRLGHVPHDYVHPSNALPEARDGVVLFVGVARSPDGTIAVESVEGTPLWTENDFRSAGEDATVRVVRLRDAAPDVCAERLPRIAEALGDEVRLLDACAAAP